jgi:hypothetical protein
MLLAWEDWSTHTKYCPIAPFVHCKFHMDWAVKDTGPPRWEVVESEMQIHVSQDSQYRLWDSNQTSSEYKCSTFPLKRIDDVGISVRLRKTSMNIASQKCYRYADLLCRCLLKAWIPYHRSGKVSVACSIFPKGKFYLRVITLNQPVAMVWSITGTAVCTLGMTA